MKKTIKQKANLEVNRMSAELDELFDNVLTKSGRINLDSVKELQSHRKQSARGEYHS